MKEKAGKDNEGKMIVHKELDALIVQLDTSQVYAAAAVPKFAALIANLLTACCVISLRFDGLKVCW